MQQNMLFDVEDCSIWKIYFRHDDIAPTQSTDVLRKVGIVWNWNSMVVSKLIKLKFHPRAIYASNSAAWWGSQSKLLVIYTSTTHNSIVNFYQETFNNKVLVQ